MSEPLPLDDESIPPPPTAHSGRPFRARIVLLLVCVLTLLLVLEAGLRLFGSKTLKPTNDERSLTYRYDAQLGWFPVPQSRKQVSGSQKFIAAHNSYGFRAPEPARPIRPGIVFLGDSLVWGFDVEASDRFTEKLQRRHPDWPIYNFGVSGYGTDQEFLLLQRYFDEYRPRMVFLVICGDNDNEDNAWNCRGGYYKPWFTLTNGQLQVHGLPVPHSEKTFMVAHPILAHSRLAALFAHAFYRWTAPPATRNPDPPTGVLFLEMRKYVVMRGASFAVGLQYRNAELEKFLRNFNIPYVDLTTTNRAHLFATFGNHWTAQGHAFVAEKLDQFLTSSLGGNKPGSGKTR